MFHINSRTLITCLFSTSDHISIRHELSGDGVTTHGPAAPEDELQPSQVYPAVYTRPEVHGVGTVEQTRATRACFPPE